MKMQTNVEDTILSVQRVKKTEMDTIPTVVTLPNKSSAINQTDTKTKRWWWKNEKWKKKVGQRRTIQLSADRHKRETQKKTPRGETYRVLWSPNNDQRSRHPLQNVWAFTRPDTLSCITRGSNWTRTTRKACYIIRRHDKHTREPALITKRARCPEKQSIHQVATRVSLHKQKLRKRRNAFNCKPNKYTSRPVF